jgi:hypothetical protein
MVQVQSARTANLLKLMLSCRRVSHSCSVLRKYNRNYILLHKELRANVLRPITSIQFVIPVHGTQSCYDLLAPANPFPTYNHCKHIILKIFHTKSNVFSTKIFISLHHKFLLRTFFLILVNVGLMRPILLLHYCELLLTLTNAEAPTTHSGHREIKCWD